MPNAVCGTVSMSSGASISPISRILPALLDAMTSLSNILGRPMLRLTDLQSGFLRGHQLFDAMLSQCEHFIELLARKWRAFRRALHFYNATAASHDYIHVRVALGVLSIIQIKHGDALKNADRNRRDEVA